MSAKVQEREIELEALKEEFQRSKAAASGEEAPAAADSTLVLEPSAPLVLDEAPPPAPPDGEPGARRVLIVEDDEAMLNLLEILIRRDGFEIERATTGEAALEKLKRRPGALILDLMLPGTSSGFQVLNHLRRAARPVPPVIVVTAYDHAPEVKEVKEDPNVILFMSKPINQKRLLEALHKAFEPRPSPRAA